MGCVQSTTAAAAHGQAAAAAASPLPITAAAAAGAPCPGAAASRLPRPEPAADPSPLRLLPVLLRPASAAGDSQYSKPNTVAKSPTPKTAELESSIGEAAIGESVVGEPVVGEPNPPVWGEAVRVFSPTDPDIQEVVEAAFAVNGGQVPEDNGQFSSKRFAFLFKPGSYAQDVPVGYYTTVAGLGLSPDDVCFTGSKGVYCQEGSSTTSVGALDTFWRSAENFMTEANYNWGMGAGMLWAVSQAAPLRRIHVAQNLALFETGYASGGFLADSAIEGSVMFGGQQQWCSRNVTMGSSSGSLWNMVFVGCEGAPAQHLGPPTPIVSCDSTPVVAEKPFIIVDSSSGTDKFSICLPAVRENSAGAAWRAADMPDQEQIPFERVYVARADVDTASTINQKLASLEIDAVVITPGIYQIDDTLVVPRSNQVVLGLGMATLQPQTGKPAIRVAEGTSGVRLAGLVFDAGPVKSPTLLEFGSEGGYLQDIFCRVGGPYTYEVSADTMVQITADGVVGDNLWLWRADHSVEGLVKNSANPCNTGLQVDGDGVTMYGLMSEHMLGDLVMWNGNGGSTYFFQSELPYDVTPEYGDKGFAGYHVADSVTSHSAYGIGVYHYFRDYPVQVKSGIRCPPSLQDNFVGPVSVYLNGLGTIEHVVNDSGAATSAGGDQTAYVYGTRGDLPIIDDLPKSVNCCFF